MMKKIKKFVALGLLVCGLVNCSVPSMAKEATNEHTHYSTIERGDVLGNWIEKHSDANGKICEVYCTVNKVYIYCGECNELLGTYTYELRKHQGCNEGTVKRDL